MSEIVARTFKAGPVELAYIDEGDGEPIVLVHGFASNKEVNWVHPGWVTTLRRAGRRTIALDNRGHGASTKLYDPALYHTELMADDIRRRFSAASAFTSSKRAGCRDRSLPRSRRRPSRM